MTEETLASIVDPGLTASDVLTQQRQEGFNELPSAQSRSLLSLAWDAIQDPIFLLLVGGGVIYWILGDLQEALILLGFVVFITGISLYQEGKTEHALEALRDLSSPRALVVRDGQRKRIAGREVVRGDILILAEGDRVPADAIVLSCTNLSTDESLLTGESLPVRKVAAIGDVKMARPGGDELPFVFSGTLVVQGQGIVRVRSIGAQTEMGKIGNALQQVKPEVTPLQREMNRLVSRLLGIALALCVAIVVIYGFTTGDWMLLRAYPLSPELLAMSHIWQSADGKQYEIATKGAPEAIAGMSLIPVLFKLPLVLLPIHVAFLHLIIDPACSIVLEAEPAEANVMQRPPRNPKEPLFGRKTVGLAVLQGSGILVIILAIFVIALDRGQGELDARALTFTTLILANLGLILSESSSSRLSLKILKSPNPTLWWTIGGGLFFLAIVLYLPFLRNLFSFSFLHPIDLGICLGGGAISLLWFELLKLLNRSPSGHYA